MKIFVSHAWYGCDTGCCGHILEIEDQNGLTKEVGRFNFHHPHKSENLRKWVENLISDELGSEHIKDLDWDSCQIWDWEENPLKSRSNE